MDDEAEGAAAIIARDSAKARADIAELHAIGTVYRLSIGPHLHKHGRAIIPHRDGIALARLTGMVISMTRCGYVPDERG
jgi:hypothetical protein